MFVWTTTFWWRRLVSDLGCFEEWRVDSWLQFPAEAGRFTNSQPRQDGFTASIVWTTSFWLKTVCKRPSAPWRMKASTQLAHSSRPRQDGLPIPCRGMDSLLEDLHVGILRLCCGWTRSVIQVRSAGTKGPSCQRRWYDWWYDMIDYWWLLIMIIIIDMIIEDDWYDWAWDQPEL